MDFDHILLLGYGAPSKKEEVMPFLRAMCEGRDIPEESLKALAKHYEWIGGGSPYNAQVAGFVGHLEKELHSVGIKAPIFTGMKNWHPLLGDALSEIHQKGYRKGLAVPLTPYGSASAGAGYRENLKHRISEQSITDLHYQFIEGWYDQKLFIEAQVEEVLQVFQAINPAERTGIPILFSFHSLPACHDAADPVSHYAEEARAASSLVAERLGHKNWTVVFQSRPMSARTAWLRPEIGEEVKALAEKGERRVLIVPLGFLCDHAEILYDLDCAAREEIERTGMKYLRAKTILRHPKIVSLLRTLIEKVKASKGLETFRTP